MSDSKHWLEEGAPAEFERLLVASRKEEPASGGVERALLAAGIVAAASLASGTAAGAAGGAASKALLGGATKWFVIGALSGGAFVGAATVAERKWSSETTPTPYAASYEVASKANDRVRPSVVGSEPVDTPPAVVEPTPAPSEGSPRKELPSLGRPAASASDSDSAFAEELALVDRARSKLRAGDAAGALRSASDYERRYPAGRFAPEALFLLMQARLELGQSQNAADAAREIIRRFPNAAQVARAREVLTSTGANENP
jgi:TolA-binding protein